MLLHPIPKRTFMLHVSVEERGDTLYLGLSGRMDGGPGCDSLSSTVETELGRGQRRFAFNLDRLISMSSEGIGCLIAILASIRSSNGSMVLLSPNKRVRHVLEVTQLLPKVFDVIDEGIQVFPAITTSPA
jgi:anti-anti-sigma factor